MKDLSHFLIKSIVFCYKTKTIGHAELIRIANYDNKHSPRRILQASMDNCIPNDYNHQFLSVMQFFFFYSI